MLNRQVGRYKVTNFLGKRSGLELFRAVHPDQPATPFALRIIPFNGSGDKERFKKYLRDAARHLGQLQHPHAVRYHEFLLGGDSAFLISEYVNGHPLSALVQPNGIHAFTHAIGLLNQACEAVAAAHAQGLLHGAINADRVMYAQEKTVKVDDFGLPQLLQKLGADDEQQRPGYLAPELIAGEQPSVPSEIYALGAMLVHLLTGKPPRPEPEDGAASPSQQLGRRRPDSPQRVLDLVAKATQSDPQQRYKSVAEICALLADRQDAKTAGASSGLVQIDGLGPMPAKPSSRHVPEIADLPEMVRIPAGTFTMGSDRRPNEEPSHEVELDCFEIARYPVTNRQYRKFCDATQREYPEDPIGWGDYGRDCPDHPVVHVGWRDTEIYCNWLSELTGKKHRLPTEQEWEKAARGGLEQKQYPWGDEEPDDRAHFGFRAYAWEMNPEGPQTCRVGSFQPNGYGLFDMAGNVFEWTSDYYKPYGVESGTGKVFRVARGGCWSTEADLLRCAYRMSFYHKTFDFFIGFRCACSCSG